MAESHEERVKKLIERMDRERGFSRLWRNLLAERDPDFMENYHEKAMYVFHRRSSLPLKFKEILACCMDALTWYEPGFRVHARNAFKAGATEDEILEALEVCTILGIHYLSIQLPALVEEWEAYKKEKRKEMKEY